MKHFARHLLRSLLFAAALLTGAQAETPFDRLLNTLQPAGRVNDFAGVVPPQDRQTLEQIAADLEAKTTAELAVVTLQSLAGGDIDDFANKLFAKWGIGKKGKDNGILLIVSIEDRAARIEVGYGLEHVLPDAMAGRVLDQTLFPAFREQKYGQGLIDASRRIAGIVGGDRNAIAASSSEPPPLVFIIFFVGAFVSIGAFFLGGGLGARQVPPAFFGFLFSGGGFVGDFMLYFAEGAAGRNGGWILPFAIHTSLAVLLIVLGYRAGRRNPTMFRNSGGGSGGWRSGGGFSGGGGFSSGGGGFGGGRSGGGGASGRW